MVPVGLISLACNNAEETDQAVVQLQATVLAMTSGRQVEWRQCH